MPKTLINPDRNVSYNILIILSLFINIEHIKYLNNLSPYSIWQIREFCVLGLYGACLGTIILMLIYSFVDEIKLRQICSLICICCQLAIVNIKSQWLDYWIFFAYCVSAFIAFVTNLDLYIRLRLIFNNKLMFQICLNFFSIAIIAFFSNMLVEYNLYKMFLEWTPLIIFIVASYKNQLIATKIGERNVADIGKFTRVENINALIVGYIFSAWCVQINFSHSILEPVLANCSACNQLLLIIAFSMVYPSLKFLQLVATQIKYTMIYIFMMLTHLVTIYVNLGYIVTICWWFFIIFNVTCLFVLSMEQICRKFVTDCERFTALILFFICFSLGLLFGFVSVEASLPTMGINSANFSIILVLIIALIYNGAVKISQYYPPRI